MRQAITRLVVFVALLVAMDRLVYAGATFLRDHAGYPMTGIDLIYDEGGWNPPIVFFGDSRTRLNFDMREVENLTGLAAYDLGYDNASAEQSLFMLEEYLRQGHRPSVVIFEADPMFLDKRYGAFHKEAFRDHVAVVPDPSDLLRQSRPTLQQRASAFAVTWLMKSASFPNRLPDLWRRWRAQGTATGSETLFHPCGPPERHMLCRYYNGADNFVIGNGEHMTGQLLLSNIDTERTALFEHIVTLAEQNDFRLMLLETPLLHSDQAYAPEQKRRADAFYCGLAQAHRSVLYAQMTHIDGIDREPALYWDWMHFNGIGATKMSQLIAPLISALANRQRPEACLLQ
jgi:hypothetical protein